MVEIFLLAFPRHDPGHINPPDTLRAMPTSKSGALAPREQPEKDQRLSPRRELPGFFLWLLPVSFALQLALIAALQQYRVRPGNDHFEFGWEMGRVARSIAQGHGFSNPYDGKTGPTAW